MKISYNWLKTYLDTDLSTDELAVIMTDIGLEVEGVEHWESIKGSLEGLVIGEVKTCSRHPQADKLSVTTVDVGGNSLLPIVCGAPNVAAGQKVVVATVGATLYMGDDSLVIKKAKLRGEPSEGMICAEDEIGVGTSHDGIIVLPAELVVGAPASSVFPVVKDTIFEIGLTPNRIDAASHYGVARDIAAYLKVRGEAKLSLPDVSGFAVDSHALEIPVEIVSKEACPRYSAVTISGIKVGPSPEWLKNSLLAIGQRPINNVVDVTNFVLHEIGHPLHAFDADAIEGKKVVVRTMADGTEFETLDEQTRKLADEDLMICNSEAPMCIAGVFGGARSGVSESTTKVFLESAYFNPVSVRKTSKRHLLHTDASFRFERGADPNITLWALKRAAMLIKQVAGGEISSEIVDEGQTSFEAYAVEARYSRINQLIGKEIPRETILQILSALDIEVAAEEGDVLQLRVPPYRVDVQREADVVEEILRIYGYNNIELSQKLSSSLSYAQPTDRNDALQNKFSEFLTAQGFFEIMSNSLTKADYYKGLNCFEESETVMILNPLSSDLNAMRQSLFFGAMEAVSRNIGQRNLSQKLYEFGTVYKTNSHKYAKEPLAAYHEEKQLALVATGNARPESWNETETATSFYELKRYFESVLTRMAFVANDCTREEVSNDMYLAALTYSYKGVELGTIGIVHPARLAAFDIEEEVFYAELNWSVMCKNKLQPNLINELPKFPKVRRDLALLVENTQRFEAMRQTALASEPKLLKEVGLFDVYEGKGIPEGKRSYALSFVLQDENKTLTDKQIEKVMSQIAKRFEDEFGAKLR